MLSISQKACDKVMIFMQNNRANCIAFAKQHISMTNKSTPKVQLIYELCQKTFTPSGLPTPSPQAIQKLSSLLDTVNPSDVGLKEENLDENRGHGFFGIGQLNRVDRWAQPITYIDVYECDSFTMCIFCFPTSAVIPLHDHPGMTVFSKILYGSLYVKAYDWVEPAIIQEVKEPVRLAKLAVDKVLTAPCETSVLYPNCGGNVHCFTAVSPCAILDILTPPYREDVGRKCTYYHDYSYPVFSTADGIKIHDGKVEDYAWLAKIETPDDLYMRSGKYAGPVIQG